MRINMIMVAVFVGYCKLDLSLLSCGSEVKAFDRAY
jgi:hypothetical protein